MAATICTDWVTEGHTEVSIVLTDDDGIRVLNAEWRGLDQATDVLSFPQFDLPVPRNAPCLGDVVISVETARRQAQELGNSLTDEMVILLVHGLLHLLGEDHEAPEDSRRMADCEGRWLKRFRIDSGLIQRTGVT